MTWLLVLLPLVLLPLALLPWVSVMRRNGWTMRGRYETDTHVCRPPRSARHLPEGTRWKCRRCGMSWTLDTHGASWRCRVCRLEWRHDHRPVRDPGPWGTVTDRIAQMERELGLGGDDR